MITIATKFTLFISLLASIGFTGCYFIYKKFNSKRIPKKWRKLANITNLYIYPLKSGRYTEVDEVECTKVGFRLPAKNGNLQLRDRQFIVYAQYDMTGKTARIYHKMVLISVSSRGDNIIFEAPDKELLFVRIVPKTRDNVKHIKLMDVAEEYITTVDLGDEASKWFSQYLRQEESGLRLGYYDDAWSRDLKSFIDDDSLKCYKYLTNDAFGLYSDLGAVHLVNQKTVDDLNEKLVQKVSPTQFRPNIVINGPELERFAEDRILWLKIGNVIARNVQECPRCIFTTIDPETGIRDKTRQPLLTLAK
ncbi:hypothetical protein WA026_014749 [Henosepilachna vigintioctopunctata]|uniref:MOSC domain-containing protein n=1 Tax=Henosepilachna vigintioctopunctata TaxID=420089 RepID=A0AAW1VFS6_9CUCU